MTGLGYALTNLKELWNSMLNNKMDIHGVYAQSETKDREVNAERRVCVPTQEGGNETE